MKTRTAITQMSGRPGLKTGHTCTAAFSLLEVLCAVMILAFALVGLTQGITTALRNNKESEVQTAASLFAAGLVETLRAEGGLVSGRDDGTCGSLLPQCDWQQEVRTTELDGLYEVQVSVVGKDGKSFYELKTMLFEAPLGSATTNRAGGQLPSTKRSRRSSQ